MKKKIVVLIALVILTSLGIIIILNNKNKPYEITDDNDGQFAFYYENDNGEYQKSTDSKWNSGNYILNLENTTCDGENNPSFLSWNNDNNSVTLTTNKATKCSLYFDVKTYDRICDDNSLTCYIAQKHDTQVGDKQGEELIYHNNTIDVNGDGVIDDAGDLSYRYSGDNPDNFVCFGSYESPCPVENLYRIIGVFPFTKEDGTIEYRVKLIKSEYITEDELGISSYVKNNANTSEGAMEGNYLRIQNSKNIDTFQWVGSNVNNNWNNSQLKIALNNTYYNNFSSSWRNMIENTNWSIGGIGEPSTNGRFIYNQEVGNERLKENDVKCANSTSSENVPCTKDLLETKAFIGMMYISDYFFTSASNNWIYSTAGYSNITNRSNNWLYNGVYEYSMTRYTENKSAWHIDVMGYVGRYSESVVKSQTVRPAFYLKSNVKYVSGLGTSDNPYTIADSFDYDFINDIQVFTAPATGDYKLEVWGAQGGTSEDYAREGKGGYSTGIVSLNAGEKLYVYVGGQGSSTSENGVYKGGFNGGGDGATGTILAQYAYGGGGATHIAKSTGILSSLSNNTNDILIVAGGGGGNGCIGEASPSDGGAGGGMQGKDGFDGHNNAYTQYVGLGATQSIVGTCPDESNGNCGSFGQGGSAIDQMFGGGGGGGGYFGGSQSTRGHAGGGGGSGYIGNSLLKNGETIAGDSEMPSPISDTETGHEGNGFARIALILYVN